MLGSKTVIKTKEHSRSIGHSTIGGIIAEYLIKGVPTMIAWVAVILAWLRDVPLWLVILIGSAVFLILSVAFYFITAGRILRAKDLEQEQAVIETREAEKINSSKVPTYTSRDGIRFTYTLEPANIKAMCPEPNCNTPLEIVERDNVDDKGNHRVEMTCPQHSGKTYGEQMNENESDYPNIRKQIASKI